MLIVDLIKGVPTPWPRIESDDYLMSVGSARPLEDAFRIAQHDLIMWIGAECGLDPLDGYQLVTQASESPIANVCDPNYSVVAKIRKSYLPNHGAYFGMHARMREMSTGYRATS